MRTLCISGLMFAFFLCVLIVVTNCGLSYIHSYLRVSCTLTRSLAWVRLCELFLVQVMVLVDYYVVHGPVWAYTCVHVCDRREFALMWWMSFRSSWGYVCDAFFYGELGNVWKHCSSYVWDLHVFPDFIWKRPTFPNLRWVMWRAWRLSRGFLWSLMAQRGANLCEHCFVSLALCVRADVCIVRVISLDSRMSELAN